MLKPMSFEQISYLAPIVASVGVIVSLIFVALQIKHNTGALQRNEHNSTMAQWTVIRMAIAKNRDIARCLSQGNFRSDGWATPVRLAQDGAWRDLVAQRQTYGLHSWVRGGRRRRAGKEHGASVAVNEDTHDL
jgi:hypothetical protein